MLQRRVYSFNEVDWKPFSKDCVTKIYSRSLLLDGFDILNISLTKVEPGGEFGMHTDAYNHIFYFLIGTGEGRIGDETYEIRPGVVAEVPAGEVHAYKNRGKEEMFLITMNISEKQK